MQDSTTDTGTQAW